MIEIDVRAQLGAFSLDAAFHAPSRGVVALFGRSGAGKTTLINLLAGMLCPASGRISVDGTVFFDTAAKINVPVERRRIGFVFQDSRLFPHLTVEGNLRYGLSRAPASDRRIAFPTVVDVLGIAHLLRRRPFSLSGGERQRVALGRALLAQPRLLLMDEPLASLDAPRKAEILPYIERLRDEFALPMVYVSHSLDEVIRLADHLLVISDGRIVASGALTDIVSRLDLQPMLGRFEAGAVVDCTVVAHDDHYQLTTLGFDGGQLTVPLVDRAIGAHVRARVRARDVALALTPPADLSITNQLAGVVTALAVRDAAFVDVAVAVGTATIRALISRQSRDRLKLDHGSPVWALIKTVALDTRSVGFMRRPRGMMDVL